MTAEWPTVAHCRSAVREAPLSIIIIIKLSLLSHKLCVIITTVAFVGAVSAVTVSITSESGVNTVSTLTLKLPRLTPLYAVCTHKCVCRAMPVTIK